MTLFVHVRRLVPFLAICLASCDKTPGGGSATTDGIRTTRLRVGDSTVVEATGELSSSQRLILDEVKRFREDSTSSIGQLGAVRAMALTADGGLVIFDESIPALIYFDVKTGTRRQIGRAGSGPGEYRRLNGLLAMPDSSLVFWDALNGRVSRITTSGTVVAEASVPTGLFMYNGLVRTEDARVYVHQRAANGGELLREVFGKAAVADSIVVSGESVNDASMLRIKVKDGERAVLIPFAPAPLREWSPSVGVVTGSTATYSLSWGGVGRRTTFVRKVEVLPIPPNELAFYKQRFLQSLGKDRSAVPNAASLVPKTRPALVDVLAGDDGRLFVRLSSRGEEVTVRTFNGSDTTSLRTFWRPSEMLVDVLESDGQYVGQFEVPRNFSFMGATGSLIWGVSTDASTDVPTPVLFQFKAPSTAVERK